MVGVDQLISPKGGVVSNSTGGTLTLTAAKLIPGSTVIRTADQVCTDTTDTVSLLVTAYGLISFPVIYYNASAYTLTLAGGTGVTIAGTTAIPAGRTSVLYISLQYDNTGTANKGVIYSAIVPAIQ